MTEQTKRALLEVAYALSQDKEARQQLQTYGDLAGHIHNAIVDLLKIAESLNR